MPTPIAFYFDFSSPYSYLASEQIEALAARYGRSVDYRPTLLGAVFRVSGQRPLTEIPLKGAYSVRDFARCARYAGLAFHMPTPFPISTVHAARAFLLLQGQSGDAAQTFLHAVFRAYFVHGRNVSEPAILHEVLTECAMDAMAVLAAAAQSQNKEALKAAVDAAIAHGVFGAPFFVVDGEPFWGADRLPQMERWLATGPF